MLPSRHIVGGGQDCDFALCLCSTGHKGSWPGAEAPRTTDAPYMRTAGKQCVSQSRIQPGGGLFGATRGQHFLNKYCKGGKGVGLGQEKKLRVGNVRFDS